MSYAEYILCVQVEGQFPFGDACESQRKSACVAYTLKGQLLTQSVKLWEHLEGKRMELWKDCTCGTGDLDTE